VHWEFLAERSDTTLCRAKSLGRLLGPYPSESLSSVYYRLRTLDVLHGPLVFTGLFRILSIPFQPFGLGEEKRESPPY